MTECPRGCGACCDPVVLSFDPALISPASPNAAFVRDHWTVIDTVPGRANDGTPSDVWRVRCDAFDTATRECRAYADRPPVCRDYPWYGGPPRPSMTLDNVCAYHDDIPGRRVLPLTVITRERAA